MPNQLKEPKENDNVECHLQQVGMGTLICRAARQTGDKTTNEVNQLFALIVLLERFLERSVATQSFQRFESIHT